MEAIRKKKVQRIGRQIIIDLPEAFKAEEMEVIILSSNEENESIKDSIDLEEWRKSLRKEFSKFNIDLSNLKYTRDELYDRP
jgi:predicted Zn-dependent protease with MMP-like domain